LDFVHDKGRWLGQRRSRAAQRQPDKAAFLSCQQRVAGRDKTGKRWVLREKLNRPLECGHVIVFPDRHMLVQVTDQGGPPADHPAAGRAKKGQTCLLDEPVVFRAFVRLNPNSPLTVNAIRVSSGRLGRAIVTARH
jgi:hypothetical protein